MTSMCVIPARRGSKRLHEKVLRTVDGDTLLTRAIRVALGAACFELVTVSTDDEHIAEQALAEGVDVRVRPPELADDTVGVAEVVLDACRALPEGRLDKRDPITCLSPVYPLLTAASVRAAHERFTSSEAQFLSSVVPTDPHHFHWALKPLPGGYAEMYFGDEFLRDRAFLPPVLSPTGAIKMARRQALERRGYFFGPELVAFELSRVESHYVADELDLSFARFLAEGGP